MATPVLAQDITIAVAGPMTGPVASIGDQMKRGAEAAAQAINDAGGVNGNKIKIVVEDDACDPKQAVAVANLIVGQQIKFVDGHACSGSSIPASDVYAENNVLMMSPASSNPVLTEKGHPTILRLYGRDDAQGAFIAPWIAEKYKGKKIAILHDKSAYGKGVATVVKDKLNAAGVTEVMFEGINPGEKDYSAIVTKLKGAGADVVYFGGYHPEAGLIIRQAADQGYKPQLIDPRQPRDLGVLADLGPGGRRRAVHLPDRSAPLARRRPRGRAVQGAGLQSGRLHAVQLRRHQRDRRRDQEGGLRRSESGRQGARGRPAGRDRDGTGQVRRQGRHQGSELRYQRLERGQVRSDRPVNNDAAAAPRTAAPTLRGYRRGRPAARIEPFQALATQFARVSLPAHRLRRRRAPTRGGASRGLRPIGEVRHFRALIETFQGLATPFAGARPAGASAAAAPCAGAGSDKPRSPPEPRGAHFRALIETFQGLATPFAGARPAAHRLRRRRAPARGAASRGVRPIGEARHFRARIRTFQGLAVRFAGESPGGRAVLRAASRLGDRSGVRHNLPRGSGTRRTGISIARMRDFGAPIHADMAPTDAPRLGWPMTGLPRRGFAPQPAIERSRAVADGMVVIARTSTGLGSIRGPSGTYIEQMLDGGKENSARVASRILGLDPLLSIPIGLLRAENSSKLP